MIHGTHLTLVGFDEICDGPKPVADSYAGYQWHRAPCGLFFPTEAEWETTGKTLTLDAYLTDLNRKSFAVMLGYPKDFSPAPDSTMPFTADFYYTGQAWKKAVCGLYLPRKSQVCSAWSIDSSIWAGTAAYTDIALHAAVQFLKNMPRPAHEEWHTESTPTVVDDHWIANAFREALDMPVYMLQPMLPVDDGLRTFVEQGLAFHQWIAANGTVRGWRRATAGAS